MRRWRRQLRAFDRLYKVRSQGMARVDSPLMDDALMSAGPTLVTPAPWACLPSMLPCSLSTQIQSTPVRDKARDTFDPGNICQQPYVGPPCLSAFHRRLDCCIKDIVGDEAGPCLAPPFDGLEILGAMDSSEAQRTAIATAARAQARAQATATAKLQLQLSLRF